MSISAHPPTLEEVTARLEKAVSDVQRVDRLRASHAELLAAAKEIVEALKIIIAHAEETTKANHT